MSGTFRQEREARRYYDSSGPLTDLTPGRGERERVRREESSKSKEPLSWSVSGPKSNQVGQS